ncbi:penicillin-binding protein 2 (PBP-2) [Klebsiella pneumoniae]|uniref:Penicillin-binding protein 2 (PBP-2) n=1 Tax=Klebsiella pneumoniae TaxID=573 RepID=A0A2X3ET31_KLEPN|nr:penicillin-binding protein 2 (PBP-2) [Klebsiella pneumoniae]
MITRNTSLFDPGWWQLPGSEKRYRDWKKWGHGHLNVTKALEESADTYSTRSPMTWASTVSQSG